MKSFKEHTKPQPMSRVVRGGFPDRQFDVDFWQAQGDAAIFDAAWDLVEVAEKVKGSNVTLKPDFKDVLRSFNKHHVAYLIVGGYALMKYTEPFYTKDIDLWIEPTTKNATKTFAALVEFDAAMADLTIRDLTRPKTVFQYGIVPARVDVMTTIDGVKFAEAWKNRVETHLDDITICVISLHDLMRNKEASNRDTDRIHLERLRKYVKA